MDTKIIGSKIVLARKKVNMSQAELAQQLFISPQAVGKWERGESMPDITTFNRLAEILGVDLNYFSENSLPATDTVNASPVKPIAEETHQPEGTQQVQIDLTAVDLQSSDFAGVILHNGKFKSSSLHGADFIGSELTGSLFETVDAREAKFDNANLADCHFSITDLTDASFRTSQLVGTVFSMSGSGALFTAANLKDTQFIKTDLRKTRFENCVFNGTSFNHCDLRGLHFDGQTFTGVRFEKSALNDVSFKGATLRNVSFTLPFSLTNKSYLAMNSISFEDTKMDKLTYAALKGLRVADLSKVTLI